MNTFKSCANSAVIYIYFDLQYLFSSFCLLGIIRYICMCVQHALFSLCELACSAVICLSVYFLESSPHSKVTKTASDLISASTLLA